MGRTQEKTVRSATFAWKHPHAPRCLLTRNRGTTPHPKNHQASQSLRMCLLFPGDKKYYHWLPPGHELKIWTVKKIVNLTREWKERVDGRWITAPCSLGNCAHCNRNSPQSVPLNTMARRAGHLDTSLSLCFPKYKDKLCVMLMDSTRLPTCTLCPQQRSLVHTIPCKSPKTTPLTKGR